MPAASSITSHLCDLFRVADASQLLYVFAALLIPAADPSIALLNLTPHFIAIRFVKTNLSLACANLTRHSVLLTLLRDRIFNPSYRQLERCRIAYSPIPPSLIQWLQTRVLSWPVSS
jgi:hypothetical protein